MIKDMKDEVFTKQEIAHFEGNHLQVFKGLADLTKAKKDLEKQEKDLKAKLEKAMDEYDIKSIDNDYLKVTRIAATSSTSIDLKTLEKEEPKLYTELLEDYPKVTNRSGYVRFTVK